ncbi:Trypsin-like peptidase domain protein [uncultured archaeon]|nr:Trypsin-like peptidase domain protein [uncultured archaeon]
MERTVSRRISLTLTIVIVILVLQLVLVVLIINKLIEPSLRGISKTELEEKISSNNEYITSLVNQINKNLSTVSKHLQKEINTIKANTSSDFTGIIEHSLKGIVSIKTDSGQGTGFVISPDGYIVTNAHVLSDTTYANAITPQKQIFQMELIGYNNTLDIALLKINQSYENYFNFTYTNNVKVGEKVIAIGNPLGLGFSVSEGIVSAINRRGGENYLPAYIQTDVSLNPGNSGGPLIGSDGNVIGINNYKLNAENIGFALESDYIKNEINKISLEKLNKTLIS